MVCIKIRQLVVCSTFSSKLLCKEQQLSKKGRLIHPISSDLQCCEHSFTPFHSFIMLRTVISLQSSLGRSNSRSLFINSSAKNLNQRYLTTFIKKSENLANPIVSSRSTTLIRSNDKRIEKTSKRLVSGKWLFCNSILQRRVFT